MKLRPFGNTGMQVSEIGLGAWQLANPDWGANDEQEALRIVQASLDAGCNFFDTAPGYNHGRSEEFLGQVLRPVRQEIIICSKFGHTAEGVSDFSRKAIRPSLEASLKRLQTDTIDILLMHNPPREMMDGRSADQYAELEKLKQEGKIQAYGISLDWKADLELMMDTTRSQAAEVFFNAFYQEPKPAFARARLQGVGLIVKVPLDSGWLSGRYRQGSQFEGVRNRWSAEVIERRGALVEQFEALVPAGESMAHTALQFCLAQPEVSTVIPGAKTVAQALDNFAAADHRLDRATLAAIEALWEKDIAAEPLPW
jgi:aryl-alcohol dehydrogenase-like predicted oxidoreductase